MSLSSIDPIVQGRGVQAVMSGFATAVPTYSIDQAESAVVAQQLKLSDRWSSALPTLYKKSGVRRRGSVLLGPETSAAIERQSFYQPASAAHPYGPSTSARMQLYAAHAGPLLEQACIDAIDQSEWTASSITHLITISCTGFFAPGVDIALIERLGLRTNVQRTHVGFMGCHALINGLRAASAIVEANPSAVVLVGAIELCSLHQQYTDDAQQLVANALFADGAGAIVLSASTPDGLGFTESDTPPDSIPSESTVLLDPAHSSNDRTHWHIVDSLSKWLPGTSGLMSWTIGDYGFRMTLDPQVPNLIEQHLKPEMEAWLQRHGLEIDDIESWAIHPGGPRIIQSTGNALGLSDEQLDCSKAILSEHGNMSSPTVLFILDKLTQQPSLSKFCVMIAFGPGLCIEALLLTR
jgi:predicted naringenin-chalcone synthase